MGVGPAEEALLRRCRRGDQQAWARLFRQYSPRVRGFVRGMLGPEPDVDDVVQRVFLEFLSSLDRFRGEASLATWLHRIAHNVVAKRIRGQSRHRRKLDAYAMEPRVQHSPSSEHSVAAAQQLRRLKAAVQQLDARFRAVWVMRELQRMDVAEVAAALRISPATVRTRHHRARQKVLQALAAPAPQGGAARRGSPPGGHPALYELYDGAEAVP